MLVRDYGSVPKSFQKEDGSIHFYMRVARANHKMPYWVMKDGQPTKIMRNVPESTLFGAKSMTSMSHTYLLDGHTGAQPASPDNRSQVIGFTGIPGREESNGNLFMWVLGTINDRKGIEAYKRKKEWSPEYNVVLDATGTEQLERDHLGVALVEEARGGHELRSKDSADDYCYADFEFHKSQDEQTIWNLPRSDLMEAMIARFFDAGCLDPPPVIIPEKVIITPSKIMKTHAIGSRVIKVDDDSLSDLIQIGLELEKTQQLSKDAADKDKQLADLQAENAALNKTVKDHADKLATVPDAIEAAVNERLANLKDAAEDLKLFTANGQKPIPAAQKALDEQDVKGFVTAVLADGGLPADASYVAYKAAVKKLADMAPAGGFTYVPPSQMAEFQTAAYPRVTANSISSLENPNFQASPNGLTPDGEAQGWETISAMKK